MKKKIFAILCTLVLVFSLSLEVTCASVLPFSDVKETNWYYSNLVDLYSRNIINGFEDGTFKGSATLRKDQLLKLLITTINPYADYTKDPVDKWFAPYLKKCKEFNLVDSKPTERVDTDGNKYYVITTGDTTEYNVDITRQDVAVLVDKAFRSGLKENSELNISLKGADVDTFLKGVYKDYGVIREEAKVAIYELYKLGIMQGDDQGKFNPTGILNRAEATAIIYRLRNVRDSAVGSNALDYDVLVTYGYVKSSDKSGELSNNTEQGTSLKDAHNENEFVEYTKEQIEEIFKKRSTIAEEFGGDIAVLPEEELMEFKEYLLTICAEKIETKTK